VDFSLFDDEDVEEEIVVDKMEGVTAAINDVTQAEQKLVHDNGEEAEADILVKGNGEKAPKEQRVVAADEDKM
jgi:hypothetical protein